MSIVAYYVDVDATQLQALKQRPSLVWNIRSDPRFANASMVDSEEWDIVVWLASPAKRIESCHQAAWFAAAEKNTSKTNNAEAKQLAAQSILEFGCPPESNRLDQILIAIEGRGSKEQRVPALNFGLGAARLFSPAEVKLIAVSFSKFKLEDFQRSFDRKKMARDGVGGRDWLDETDEERDEFLVPAFTQISSFYQRAAKLNHYVLVVHQ